jgi:methylated-DNA-protein-cysteine methyltransferase-like protein
VPPATFSERVRAAVRAIPHGHVASYGGVAAVVGQPRAARAVGRALCTLDDDVEVPWWRVINRNGEISIKCSMHGPALQRAALEAEGVEFDALGRVDWIRFGWDGSGVPPGVRDDDAQDDDEWARSRATMRARTSRRKRATRSRSRARSR